MASDVESCELKIGDLQTEGIPRIVVQMMPDTEEKVQEVEDMGAEEVREEVIKTDETKEVEMSPEELKEVEQEVIQRQIEQTEAQLEKLDAMASEQTGENEEGMILSHEELAVCLLFRQKENKRYIS